MQKFGAELVLKDSGFSKKISTATNAVKKFKTNTNSGSKSVGQLDKKMKSSTGSVKRWIAGFVGIGAVVVGIRKSLSFFKESAEMAANQAEQEAKLFSILKNVKGATDAQAKGLVSYAAELQKTGVVGDEVAIAGAQQLATFQLQTKSIKTLMPAMNDLIAQQKGLKATGQDAVTIANMMGRALMGQAGALTRVGISFTKSQAEILKHGNETQRASIMAEILKANVGGVNEALKKTDAGKIKSATNAIGDMQERIGNKVLPLQMRFYEFFEKNIPTIERIATGALSVMETGIDNVDGAVGFLARNVGALSQLVASGAITWGLYTGAQKLMVLWTRRQIYWGDILAMRQGGLTMILKSGTLHMALLTAGAYAWINVAKEISDVNTAVGNDTRLMTNSWEDFYLVMAKVGKFVDYTMGRFFHAVGVWNDAEYAILEKIQLKEGYDVQVKIEERSKKAKIGRYDPEWIKEQQKKAKDQMISGEKEINKALNSLKLGNLKKNAGSSATEGKEIVKVIGNKTKFSSAFDMGGNSPDADYSISSRRIAEKSEGEAKAVKVVSSGNGTQNNTFNFYDVGKKSLEELMNEFVPEFKKVCQNMG